MSVNAALNTLGGINAGMVAADPESSTFDKVEAAVELGVSIAFPIAGTLGVIGWEVAKSLLPKMTEDEVKEYRDGIQQLVSGEPANWGAGKWSEMGSESFGLVGNLSGSLSTNQIPSVKPVPESTVEDEQSGSESGKGSDSSLDPLSLGMLGLPLILGKGGGGSKGKIFGGKSSPLGGIGNSAFPVLGGYALGSMGGSSDSPSQEPKKMIPTKDLSSLGLKDKSKSGFGGLSSTLGGQGRAGVGGFSSPRRSGSFGVGGFSEASRISAQSFGYGGTQTRGGSSRSFGYGGTPATSGNRGFAASREVDAMIDDVVVGRSPYHPPMNADLFSGRMYNAQKHSR